MISISRLHRLLRVLRPVLVKMDDKEKNLLIQQIEEALGYDAEKAARLRAAAKQRNAILDDIVALKL
nr:hypothetical protein TetV2_00482 [Oceanusvirus sp.]